MKVRTSSKKNMQKKYKIRYYMNNLTVEEYRVLRKLIPILIGKCINTFNNYANLPIDAKEEIPYNIVIILEDLFGLGPRGLSNVKIECKYYKELVKKNIVSSEIIGLI